MPRKLIEFHNEDLRALAGAGGGSLLDLAGTGR